MPHSSLRFTAFIEGKFLNEDLFHEIEHRLFESEPWRTIENDPECSIEAFAYSTGILIKVRSFKYDQRFLEEAVFALASGPIFEMETSEQQRFIQESKERSARAKWNFDEHAGEMFLKEFTESSPTTPDSLSQVVTRITTVTRQGEKTAFQTKRYGEQQNPPKIGSHISPVYGEEFHLFCLNEVVNAETLAYATIYSFFVRNYLRNLFKKTGETYDIYLSAHYERNFVYFDHYWSTEETSFSFQEEDILLTQENFTSNWGEAFFLMKIGHEDAGFRPNVILEIDPEDEKNAWSKITYEGFISWKKWNEGQYRLYSK